MLYDCFPFFNELDVLEIRLNELGGIVDKFVLVESTRTFQNQPKPLHYSENKDRFKGFSDRIIHIVVDEYPKFIWSKLRPFYKPWDYSNFQKNQIKRGLANCKPDDVILVSDLDEIPKADKVMMYKDQPGFKVFQQLHFNYFLNCVCTKAPEEHHLASHDGFVYWRGTVMTFFKDFSSFTEIRSLRDLNSRKQILQIPEGGWHFSFVAEVEKLMLKLNSWEHAKETQYAQDYLGDPAAVTRIINDGGDLFGRDFRFKVIALDEKFPEYLLANGSRFQKMINASV